MTDLRPVDVAAADRARAAHTVGAFFDTLAEHVEDGGPVPITHDGETVVVRNVAGALVVLVDDEGRPTVVGRLSHQFSQDECELVLTDAARALTMMRHGQTRRQISAEQDRVMAHRAEQTATRERWLAARPHRCPRFPDRCDKAYTRELDLTRHLNHFPMHEETPS